MHLDLKLLETHVGVLIPVLLVVHLVMVHFLLHVAPAEDVSTHFEYLILIILNAVECVLFPCRTWHNSIRVLIIIIVLWQQRVFIVVV